MVVALPPEDGRQCAGHTLGGEGPTIHICTAVATTCGYFLIGGGDSVYSVLGAIGVTTGLGAAFNCPIAAIVY